MQVTFYILKFQTGYLEQCFVFSYFEFLCLVSYSVINVNNSLNV